MKLTKLYGCDYLVAGSGINAMLTALELSDKGSVTLITEDTCLYAELNGAADYRRPRSINGKRAAELFPDDILGADGLYTPDLIKRHGERVMAEHGVRLLYATAVLGTADGYAVIAHKSGLYAVECREALDCRQTIKPAEAVFCLHTMNEGKHSVSYIPVNDTGDSAAARLSRFKSVLSALPCGSTLARCGTEISEKDGISLDGIKDIPVKPLPRLSCGKRNIKCINPLFEDFSTVDLPDLYAEEESADVVIAGGGTAGASAALFCARQGLETVVLEMNKMLGGSATVGGVSTYWFGWRDGATRQIDERVNEWYKRLGISRNSYYWNENDVFLPDIKANALTELCLESGADVRFSCTVCGTETENGNITGVYYAQGGTLKFIRTKAVIDCTGDGDVCMFAGAGSQYGSEKDGMTYWGSLAQYISADNYRNNFSAMVHVGDPIDYTRFIIGGRLLGDGLCDHGQYVAVRESRHITGLETIRLEDILSMRKWDKVLYSCFSNYDPKGRLTADVVYFGLLPPNQRIDIPLGAVIPTDALTHKPIGGLLVGGKAISCTHDAFPALRMQPDLQRQGLALAALVGAALSQGVPFEKADGISERIMSLGGDLMRADLPPVLPLSDAVGGLTGDEDWEWLDMPTDSWVETVSPIARIMTASTEDVLPLLKKRWEAKGSDRLRLTLARLLLWHSDESGASEIIDEIRRQLAECDGLPKRKGAITYAQLLPDHGVMPETVYLLNSLSRSHTVTVLPLFAELAERLENSQRDWTDIKSGIYCYCECFAYTAVSRGDKGFIPLIERILALPELNGKAADDLMSERFDMLKVTLNSALLSLECEKGADGLRTLALDDRRPISEAAKISLRKNI